MPARIAEKHLSLVTRPLRRPKPKPCYWSSFRAPQFRANPSLRGFSTARSSHYEYQAQKTETPRWQATPPRMKAPFRSKPPVYNNEFSVNGDPALLDRFYETYLGKGGQRMLTEEVKWLAVTHKSFDHGRRGYNERLAFFGRMIFNLQTSLALVHHSPTSPPPSEPDNYGRIPFQHPALEGLQSLSEETRHTGDDNKKNTQNRLAQLAERYGIAEVMRWKPKKATNLHSSGNSLIFSQALLAVIGAISLQRGGEIANMVVRERLLDPLGLQT